MAFKPLYYHPCLLPEVSQACQYRERQTTTKSSGKSHYTGSVWVPCKQQPQQGSTWCQQHDYCLRLLDMACFCGCPSLLVPAHRGSEAYLLVGSYLGNTDQPDPRAGIAAWEEFAQVVTPGKAKQAAALLVAHMQHLRLRFPAGQSIYQWRSQQLAYPVQRDTPLLSV